MVQSFIPIIEDSQTSSVPCGGAVRAEGFTDNQAQSILDVIESRELIKVKILQNSRVEKEEVAKEIEEKTGCEVVGIIGKTIILFKENSEKPKISAEIKNIK